jgi:hypothetical protein
MSSITSQHHEAREKKISMMPLKLFGTLVAKQAIRTEGARTFGCMRTNRIGFVRRVLPVTDFCCSST